MIALDEFEPWGTAVDLTEADLKTLVWHQEGQEWTLAHIGCLENNPSRHVGWMRKGTDKRDLVLRAAEHINGIIPCRPRVPAIVDTADADTLRLAPHHARRISIAIFAATELERAREELEEYAPPEVIKRYRDALYSAIGQLQSPLWGPTYIHPSKLDG